MTTFAMALGALPFLWTVGAGAASRHQLGWTIFGGMIIGTLFTLYVIPVVYTLFAHKVVKNPNQDFA
jgi:multidrug efflux pump